MRSLSLRSSLDVHEVEHVVVSAEEPLLHVVGDGEDGPTGSSHFAVFHNESELRGGSVKRDHAIRKQFPGSVINIKVLVVISPWLLFVHYLYVV